MEHETIRGVIRYTSKKAAILDQVRGGESFIATYHLDGRKTLRAHCAIDENSPRVLRDSITNLDADWRPLNAYVQLTVDEAYVGSAWYRFAEDFAECEGHTLREGRIRQSFAYERRPAFFGTHPIQADAWHTHCFDLSKGPGEQESGEFFMCSFHHRGADGPILLRRAGLRFAFLGAEKIVVGAGSFGALHFRIGEHTDDDYMGTDRHPPYHIWVTDDGNYTMLKAHCTGYMQTYYELVEYEKRRNFF